MKFNDEGENKLLNVFLKSTDSPVLYMGLYKDAVEPAEDDTVSDITEETGAGYARIVLNKNDWSIVASAATQPQKTFTATADWGNVEGFFFTDTASGTTGLMYSVEHFADGPYNILSGGQVKITPRYLAS